MPIKIPETLPAFDVLRHEGVMVMSEETARRQDIRPLQIGLVNLMPKKVQTETQFARVIGLDALADRAHAAPDERAQSKHTSAAHLEAFYQPFSAARERRFDGLIITGAPIEHLEFEGVSYWDELRELFDWTQTNVHSTMAICWGGMAMLHHFHGIPKHMLPAKAFGCFRHYAVVPSSPLLQGFSDSLLVPVSRWTEVRIEDIELAPGLRVLLHSEEVGPCLIEARHTARTTCSTTSSTTRRPKGGVRPGSGGRRPITAPMHYFPDDDPAIEPENRWRSHGHLLYGNWVNQIYQTTPYELAAIGA